MEKEAKKKAGRSQQREYIVAKLYQFDLTGIPPEITKKTPFIVEAMTAITTDMSRVDTIINKNLVNWKLNRLSFVDRAILRLATYELMETDTPHEIVIDEALNLTHKFSDEGDKKHVSFNNRVLENIIESLKQKA